MTLSQKSSVLHFLTYLKADAEPGEVFEFHHGCCIGSDEQAHELAEMLEYRIVLHPPSDLSKVMKLDFDKYLCHGQLPYLKRNRVIATEYDVLIATPFEAAEIVRSGTWATVRYARQAGTGVVIAWPTGTPNDLMEQWDGSA